MPEGDTVLSVANRLHEVLGGHSLTRVDLRWPSVSVDALNRGVVHDVDAYAKHLFVRFASGVSLHTHLRMDGVWRVVPTGSREAQASSPTVRAVLATSEWTCVGYELGMMDIVSTARERDLIAHLGPDILADQCVPTHLLDQARADPARFLAPRRAHTSLLVSDRDWIEALSRFAAQPQTRPIGETLLDQSVVSGIGTIFMAEGLFTHRISPMRPLADTPLVPLLASIRGHLIRGVVRPVAGRRIHVHSRRGQPCMRCGTPIARRLVGPPTAQRPAFYCPTCQHR